MNYQFKVFNVIPELDIGKADINYLLDLAEQFKIEKSEILAYFL